MPPPTERDPYQYLHKYLIFKLTKGVQVENINLLWPEIKKCCVHLRLASKYNHIRALARIFLLK